MKHMRMATTVLFFVVLARPCPVEAGNGRYAGQYPDGYVQKVRQLVLSVVTCSNPEILVGLEGNDFDEAIFYKETNRIPYSFQKIELGPGCVGFRVDFLAGGNGWTGYRHAWLLELHDGRLEIVFELKGPYLNISDVVKNGRYLLWHWEGADPLHPSHARQRSYEWRKGKYQKGPVVHFQ